MSVARLAVLSVVVVSLLLTGVSHTHPPGRVGGAQHSAAPTGNVWDLSASDWQRYLELNAGPRGIWSPGLDPITVLGVHARDKGERRRYAERFVALEEERSVGELAFQHMVNTVVADRYGDAPLSAGSLGGGADAQESTNAERWALFSPAFCEARCQQWVYRALSLVRRSPLAQLDIYLSGASDDAGLQRWARNLGVASRQPRFRLWHDGAWRRLGADVAEVAPLRLLRRRAQAYVAVPVVMP